MNKRLLLLLNILLTTTVIAQNEDIKGFETGFLFSSRMDSDDDFKFNIKGYGIEGGYYILKEVGRKGMLSLDMRLAYSSSERNKENVARIGDVLTFPLPQIITQRTGILDYKNISLSLPIKYRYKFSNQIPIFLMVGFNPYINLVNFSKWRFTEFEYDTVNEEIIGEIKNEEEEIRQKLFSRDLILAGLGYKGERVMFDIYFSGGTIEFDNAFTNGADKLSIVINVYYKLEKE